MHAISSSKSRKKEEKEERKSGGEGGEGGGGRKRKDYSLLSLCPLPRMLRITPYSRSTIVSFSILAVTITRFIERETRRAESEEKAAAAKRLSIRVKAPSSEAGRRNRGRGRGRGIDPMDGTLSQIGGKNIGCLQRGERKNRKSPSRVLASH